MPRRHYDLDEVLALAESGRCASEIIEDLGLDVTVRAIQKAVNRYLGSRPVRQLASFALIAPVRAYMETQGLHPYYCAVCQRKSARPCFIRASRAELDACVFVCGRCTRPGDV